MTNFNIDVARSLYDSLDTFPVDFENAWQWLGYSRKDNAKSKFLKCGFVKGLDYEVFLGVQENPLGGRPSEDICLTVECLKQWGMMCGTDKGREVRMYFLECEKIAKSLSAPKSTSEMLLMYAQQLVEQEKRQQRIELSLEQVKSDVATIKQVQSDAESALKELPPATKPVPVKTTRSNLNKLIREYCHKTSVRHNDAWRELYREFKYRFHIDLGIRAANGKSAPLDVAESLDVVDDLYALACEMFKGGEK
ncbi:hypothetical protein [Nostoc piscinale]|uniref:hypothetical protein n=1 Tax=Nostoc piscinale TaxID=224012 RepID=UPI0007842511|nr:hypothetical protein [Nostoc piscinale]